MVIVMVDLCGSHDQHGGSVVVLSDRHRRFFVPQDDYDRAPGAQLEISREGVPRHFPLVPFLVCVDFHVVGDWMGAADSGPPRRELRLVVGN